MGLQVCGTLLSPYMQARVQVQGLLYARQSLYKLSYGPSLRLPILEGGCHYIALADVQLLIRKHS